jgi:hypothetical protein
VVGTAERFERSSLNHCCSPPAAWSGRLLSGILIAAIKYEIEMVETDRFQF